MDPCETPVVIVRSSDTVSKAFLYSKHANSFAILNILGLLISVGLFLDCFFAEPRLLSGY